MSHRDTYAARAAALDAVEHDGAFDFLEEREEAIERAQREARERKGRPVPEQVHLAAMHEAGHVVLAIACGAELTGAAIYDNGSGATWTGQGTGSDAHALAGAAAERFAGNSKAQPSASDARLIIGDPRARTLAGFDAEEILALHWGKVQEVAARLIERGYVSGDLARAIVGRVRLPRAGEGDKGVKSLEPSASETERQENSYARRGESVAFRP